MLAHWEERMLELAAFVSRWSKDPSTQVGAVVMRPDKTVASIGYNGFPRGVADDQARYEDRSVKYEMVVHAEVNAIVHAREPVDGMTLFTYPFPPCARCTGIVIQSGIKRIVAPLPTAEQLERWGSSFQLSKGMLEEAGVELVLA